MHGVKRVKTTREALEEKRLREQSKIKDFLALTDLTLSKKEAKDWSEEALGCTTRLLHINPEFYTVWNYRRNIFLHGLFPKSTPDVVYKFLVDDLVMTMSALRTHPKVYWIWNHRRWCLENVPDGPEIGPEDDANKASSWKKTIWDKELLVVEKLLVADPRNFLAWNYRRYILANMPNKRPEISEILYTTQKIESNFSNFSAWHQRSKVFSSLWASGQLDEAKCKQDEFDLVRNAMYTDPNDQSVWIYHRWLVGADASKDLLEREIAAIEELLDQESDNKWCMESIVHYKRMLLGSAVDGLDRTGLVNSCHALLGRLQHLDPCRRKRYQDIAQQI